jgi:serine/threonine protein kinase
VVDSLVYLAEQGVEHSALTCSNVLVSKEGAVKLGSWGVAIECDSADMARQESVYDASYAKIRR